MFSIIGNFFKVRKIKKLLNAEISENIDAETIKLLEKSLNDCNAILKERNNDTKLLLLKSEILLHLNRLDESSQYVHLLLQKDPNNIEILLLLSDIHIKKMDLDNSLKYLYEALGILKDNEEHLLYPAVIGRLLEISELNNDKEKMIEYLRIITSGDTQYYWQREYREEMREKLIKLENNL